MTPSFDSRHVAVRDDLTITVAEAGEGRPALVLHGGGGPATTQPIADHLAADMHVLAPTHPGFDGTSRPDSLTTVPELAQAHLELLAVEGLRDVLVVGNSIGGWIAMEMAVADDDGRVGALVLIDAAGLDLPDVAMADFFALTPAQIAEVSFYDPSRSPLAGAELDEHAREILAGNAATMRLLAGDPYMHDPQLPGRLATLHVPTLVVWGEADRMFPPPYGEAIADAIPGARLELLSRAGHLPQLEQPEALYVLIDGFAAGGGTGGSAGSGEVAR